ncbi:THUMP domain-containing class I SAM-dependent RNA methyltransferase [Pseudodesulfovibrio senegalensis]|uniref:Class I SAM-dependent RNA methyltransferase n=1 Tax=Pseudodesulfovibrio senegalensis TaxID=1721087 RepID=A0A6N6N1G5_9BACT|nr:class I SAM-dependent RNA methyltransferase [Pseudodesulfovibrio senegalensis]KAB1441734.1 class I SAM-dependent RNA methyltransferase [Pseudodesulfovibrio senegalensis]
MNVFENTATLLATCPLGLPPFLAEEMEALGLEPGRTLDNGVETQGTMQDCMRMNLHLHTAHRVLFELRRFRAVDADALYQTLLKEPWEDLLDADGYVSVSSSVYNDTVNDSRFANVRVKDAVADRFMQRTGRRPDSGPDQSRGVCLFLHWRDDQATLYLDTTGESLSRRGYRRMPHKAPMQETLAAACVLASNWREAAEQGGSFVAPMCGSGTLAIEAAMIALNRAPGMLGRDFAFTRVKGFDAEEYKRLRKKATKGTNKNFAGRIIATDLDPEAIRAAQTNARMAGVEDRIEFAVCDFRETEIPETPGTVMLNPEYGKRLGDEKILRPVYKDIGDFFKQHCGGYMGYIFTGNMSLAKSVGLRTKRRIILHNAKIECRLLEYELYAGTRKTRS